MLYGYRYELEFAIEFGVPTYVDTGQDTREWCSGVRRCVQFSVISCIVYGACIDIDSTVGSR